jgi:hypothetical protein
MFGTLRVVDFLSLRMLISSYNLGIAKSCGANLLRWSALRCVCGAELTAAPSSDPRTQVLMEGVSSLVVGVCLLGTLFPLCFPHFTMAKY